MLASGLVAGVVFEFLRDGFAAAGEELRDLLDAWETAAGADGECASDAVPAPNATVFSSGRVSAYIAGRFSGATPRELAVFFVLAFWGLVVGGWAWAFLRYLSARLFGGASSEPPGPAEEEPRHLYAFCQICADRCHYGKRDEYLNMLFHTAAEEHRAVCFLPSRERLDTSHGETKPHVALCYSWDQDIRRWKCNKCRAFTDKLEDKVVEHCTNCAKCLPSRFYPSRGWWPKFDMYECIGEESHVVKDEEPGEPDVKNGGKTRPIRSVRKQSKSKGKR